MYQPEQINTKATVERQIQTVDANFQSVFRILNEQEAQLKSLLGSGNMGSNYLSSNGSVSAGQVAYWSGINSISGITIDQYTVAMGDPVTGLTESIITQAADASAVTINPITAAGDLIIGGDLSNNLYTNYDSAFTDWLFKAGSTECFRLSGVDQSLTMYGANKIKFRDAGQYINSPSTSNMVISGTVVTIKSSGCGTTSDCAIFGASGGSVSVALLPLAAGGYVKADVTTGLLSVVSTATATAHNLLSGIHGDTTAASAVRGDIITAQGSSPLWTRLAITVPASGLMNYLGAANGDTEPGYKALFDAAVPGTIAEGASAATGSATVAARRDHTHGAPSTWAATAHNVLNSAYHSDVLTGSITRGDLLCGNATPKIARLAKGTSGYLLCSDATDVKWDSLANLGIAPLTHGCGQWRIPVAVTTQAWGSSPIYTDSGNAKIGFFNTPVTYPWEYYSTTYLRSYLDIYGYQYWQFGTNGVVEYGKLYYATPGGGVGITTYTYAGGNYVNRADLINYGTFLNWCFAADTNYGLRIGPTGCAAINVASFAAPSTSFGLQVGGNVAFSTAACQFSVGTTTQVKNFSVYNNTSSLNDYTMALFANPGFANAAWQGILFGQNPGYGSNYAKGGIIFQLTDADGYGRGSFLFCLNNANSTATAGTADSRLTLKADGSVLIPAFTTAGVLHNAVTTGLISSSAVVNADLGAIITEHYIPFAGATGFTATSLRVDATHAKVGLGVDPIDIFNVVGGHIGINNTLTVGGAEGNGLLLYGSMGGGTPYRSVKFIPFVPGTSSGVDYVGLKIYTANGTTNFATAMTIFPSGKISVGGTNPQQPFVVSAADVGGIEFLPSGGTSGATATQIQSYDRTGGAYVNLDFKALAFRFVTGNVGVGCDAAGALCVNGGAHIGGTTDAGDNNLLVDGTATITGAFGCNTKAAQAAYTVNAACTDLPTAVALLNQIRAALVADGICV
jgi:hypothetical protein